FSSSRPAAGKTASATAIFVGEDGALPGKDLLGESHAYLTQAIASAEFKGKSGAVLSLVSPSKTPTHLIVVGVGALAKLTLPDIEEAGARALAAALGTKATSLNLIASLPKAAKIDPADLAANLAS